MFQYLVLLLCQYQMMKIINVNVDYMEDGGFQELEDDEYFITQNINNATFYLIVSTYDIPRYIFLEIYLKNLRDGDVNFLTTIGRNQLTKLENSQILTTYADYNGFYLQKNYHNIVIPANSFKTGDKFFITNLIINDRRQYQYTLKIRKLPYQPCPNNCSSDSGKCIDGICSCGQNKIDLDCSKDAIGIQYDEQIENVAITGTQYIYFEQTIKLEKIKFELSLQDNNQQEDTQVRLYYMFEDYKYGVPTQLYRNFTILKDVMAIYTIVFDVSALNFNTNLLRFDRLIFKFVTEKQLTCNLQIGPLQSEDFSNEDEIQIIIYVTTSIGSVIIIMVFAIIIFKYKSRRQQNQLVQLPRDYKLTLEFLKTYMKRVKKRKEGHINDDNCPICLHDDEDMRLTPCQHPFHCQCLYNWLKRPDGKFECPICRRIIVLAEMKDLSQDQSNN